MAIFTALIPLIIALLPYIEKAIEALANRIHDGHPNRPLQERRIGHCLHLVGRLRDACERMEAQGTACGIVAKEDAAVVGEVE